MSDRTAEPRSPGPSYQDLLDADTRPEHVPAVFRLQSGEGLGDADLSTDRYTSREFHLLEKERLWTKVWQMACREEEIPEVGDTHVYDICDLSILVVRSAPDRIQAFYNACLHRGRLLRDTPGNATELRCPFHGFCWQLDGALKQVPCEWDFPHVDRSEWSLPEVQVDTWGGFVFVNLDPDAGSLADHLGVLPEHFTKWPLEHRFIQAHVGRVFRANWKLVQEAFMEAFHVVATHPQLLPGIGDANSQYDWWGNVSRAITPNATPSPHLTWAPTEQQMFDAVTDRRLDEPPVIELAEGMTARAVTGMGGRRRLAAVLGDAADELSDSEIADSFYYTLFPNLHPWAAYNRIVYRFRPWDDRHDMSLMECYLLEPFDPAGPRPAPAPLHLLGPDDEWSNAPELGVLARIFEQDSFNLPKVQRGLPSLRKGVTLAHYQETKIRHFHWLLSQHLTD